MKLSEATEIVSDLASQQWGLLTSAQARAAGVPAFMLSRLVKHGILVRVRHGVYAASATPFTAALEVRAQWLALNPTAMAADRGGKGVPDAVVSHESAAELQGIGDLTGEAITFTTASRRQTKQPDVRFHTAVLEPGEVIDLEGLPVTSAARTVGDLARAGHEPGHLTDVMADALSRHLVTTQQLAAALADVAELFGAASNTEPAMQARLDELFPPDDSSERQMVAAMEKVMAPLQQQLRQLHAQLAPTLKMPEIDPVTASQLSAVAAFQLSAVDWDSPALSSLRETVASINEKHAQTIGDISLFSLGAADAAGGGGAGHHRSEGTMSDKSDAAEDKDDDA